MEFWVFHEVGLFDSYLDIVVVQHKPCMATSQKREKPSSSSSSYMSVEVYANGYFKAISIGPFLMNFLYNFYYVNNNGEKQQQNKRYINKGCLRRENNNNNNVNNLKTAIYVQCNECYGHFRQLVPFKHLPIYIRYLDNWPYSHFMKFSCVLVLGT